MLTRPGPVLNFSNKTKYLRKPRFLHIIFVQKGFTLQKISQNLWQTEFFKHFSSYFRRKTLNFKFNLKRLAAQSGKPDCASRKYLLQSTKNSWVKGENGEINVTKIKFRKNC